VAPGVMPPQQQDWNKTFANIIDICKLSLFVKTPASFYSLQERLLYSRASPPSLEDCYKMAESRMRCLETASQYLLEVLGAQEMSSLLTTFCKTRLGLTNSSLLSSTVVGQEPTTFPPFLPTCPFP
jgi:hypothetical protein